MMVEILVTRITVISFPEYEWDDLQEGGDDEAGKCSYYTPCFI